MPRKYLITVQSMNRCDLYDAAGVVTAVFLAERDKIEGDSIRQLIDGLDATISQASVQFRPMTDEEIVAWRDEMETRRELADKLAGDTEHTTISVAKDQP